MRAAEAFESEIGGADEVECAAVDLAGAEPEYDLLGALSREQIEQMILLDGAWLTGELILE